MEVYGGDNISSTSMTTLKKTLKETISPEQLRTLDQGDDQILTLQIWRVSLSHLSWLPFYIGWHEYVVVSVESTDPNKPNYYLSLEKDKDAPYLQFSENLNDVQNNLFGEKRKGRIRPERRGQQVGKQTVGDIFRWINQIEIEKPFDIKNANCQYFASRLFERFSLKPIYPDYKLLNKFSQFLLKLIF